MYHLTGLGDEAVKELSLIHISKNGQLAKMKQLAETMKNVGTGATLPSFTADVYKRQVLWLLTN